MQVRQNCQKLDYIATRVQLNSKQQTSNTVCQLQAELLCIKLKLRLVKMLNFLQVASALSMFGRWKWKFTAISMFEFNLSLILKVKTKAVASLKIFIVASRELKV